MSKKDKNEEGLDKTDLMKDGPSETEKVPSEDELNPLDELKDQIDEKDSDDLTEQEKVVEGQSDLATYRDAASSGSASSGSGPTGEDAGLKIDAAADKDIFPPETADEPTVVDEPEEDDGLVDDTFEPINDPVARLHGTHDAAMAGLQTDISGSYVPPALVDLDANRRAEEADAKRLERAKEQQDAMRFDNGLRKGGRL